jgi:hypothetical protein
MDALGDPAEEVLTCQDGAAVLEKHLALGTDSVHAIVTLLFASFWVALMEEEEPFETPGQPVLDYLERACRIIGMNQVADLLKINFKAALQAFRESPIYVDENTEKNAKAINLLLP